MYFIAHNKKAAKDSKLFAVAINDKKQLTKIEDAISDTNTILVAWHAESTYNALKDAGYNTDVTRWRSVDVWRAQSGLGTVSTLTPEDFLILRRGAEDGDKAQIQKLEQVLKTYALVTAATWEVMSNNDKLTQPNWEEWHTHVKINSRGVYVDKTFAVEYCRVQEHLRDKAREIFGDLIGAHSPTEVQIINLIKQCGYNISGLTRADVKRLLSVNVQEVPAGKVYIGDAANDAKTLKFKLIQEGLQYRDVTQDNKDIRLISALDESADGKYHGAYKYNGAVTGRWTSCGVNLHNLSKDGSLDDIYAGRTAVMQHDYKEIVKQGSKFGRNWLLRSSFSSKDGVLVMADYRQIESRILAAFAGEGWKTEAFRQGKDIYAITAAKMFGIGLDKVTAELRKFGKLAELGLGYGGGAGVLTAKGVTTQVATRIVTEWRKINDNIVKLWERMMAAYTYVYTQRGSATINGVEMYRNDAGVIVKLLTERAFVCTETPDQIDGATLTARIVSGMARDVLAASLVACESAGLSVVMHNQDEIVIDTQEDKVNDARQHLEDIMINAGSVIGGLNVPFAIEFKTNKFYY